jgi:hypothetical protein
VVDVVQLKETLFVLMNFVAPLEDIAAIMAKTARRDALIVELAAKWGSAELA